MIRKLVLLGLAAFAGRKLLARNAAKGDKVGYTPRDLVRDPARDRNRRADPHFRPDPHGQVPEEDMEGLRPVTFKLAAVPAGYTSRAGGA